MLAVRRRAARPASCSSRSGPSRPAAGSNTVTWEGLIHAGGRHGGVRRGLVGKREEALGRDDLATIIYTSGTTGQPQGGDAHARQPALERRGDATQNDPLRPDDVLLSWLPLQPHLRPDGRPLPDHPGRRDGLPGRVARDARAEPRRDPADLDDGRPPVLREGLGGRRGAPGRGPRGDAPQDLRPEAPAAHLGRRPAAEAPGRGVRRRGPPALRRVRADRELAGHQLQLAGPPQGRLGRPGDPGRRDRGSPTTARSSPAARTS